MNTTSTRLITINLTEEEARELYHELRLVLEQHYGVGEEEEYEAKTYSRAYSLLEVMDNELADYEEDE